MTEEKAVVHLEAILQYKRDEIKRRIKQRDKYSIQLTIALGAIVAVSFPPTAFSKALIAAPLVSIYFTVLILYSYRIHRLLALYLREKIEPELARLCGTSPAIEWETYYVDHAVPGIRRSFFLGALWVTCVVSLAYLWMAESGQTEFRIVLIVATTIYMLAAIAITVAFWRN